MYYGHNRLWAISYLAHSGASRASRDTDLHSKCSEIVWEARTQKYSERMADFQIAGTREGCDVGWAFKCVGTLDHLLPYVFNFRWVNELLHDYGLVPSNACYLQEGFHDN